jgi:RND family efflux transporter MFP subunit
MVFAVNALAQGEMPPPPVRVAEVVMHELAPTTLVPGTVFSRDDARVSAEVPGVLVWVAEVGTLVIAGDEVARIDDKQLQLRKAEAEARITRERARAGFLKKETARLQELLDRNLTSVTQLEQTRSDYEVAQADLAVARASLAQIADQIERTILKAPFAGVIVARVLREGERVSIGNAVLRMLNPDTKEVIARAPLEYIQFVRLGQDIRIGDGRTEETGFLRTIVAVGEERSHLFEMRIDLSESSWPVGKSVRVAVPMADAREVIAVPRDALVLRRSGASVFVVNAEDNTAQQIPVEPGIGDGALIEVTGELQPGQTVIVRGNERLQPGQAVTIIEG